VLSYPDSTSGKMTRWWELKEVHMTAPRCEKEPVGPDYMD